VLRSVLKTCPGLARWRRLARVDFALASHSLPALSLVWRPLWQVPRLSFETLLHEVSGGGASAGRATARLQRLLVISEVALSGRFAYGSCAFDSDLWRLQHESPGFDTRDVLTAK